MSEISICNYCEIQQSSIDSTNAPNKIINRLGINKDSIIASAVLQNYVYCKKCNVHLTDLDETVEHHLVVFHADDFELLEPSGESISISDEVLNCHSCIYNCNDDDHEGPCPICKDCKEDSL